MKAQQILYTTALSLALAAGSSAAFAENHTGGAHSDGTPGQNTMGSEAHQQNNSLNHNDTETMRNEATDEEMPNRGSRAVPGAANEGKNPDIDPEANEDDFVE